MQIRSGITSILVGLVIILQLIACNAKPKPKIEWSPEEKKIFTETCVENSKLTLGEDTSIRYCACMLVKVEAKYPDPNAAGNMPISETLQLAKECLK